VVWISKIKDNARVRTSSTTITSEDVFEVDGSVEAQATVWEDVNPMALVVTRGVENRDLRNELASGETRRLALGIYIASLNKVTSNKQVLLVRGNLDVVRSNDWLILVGVIKTNGVVKVRDVHSGDVVAECEGEVGEFAVVRDIGVDGNGVLCLFTK
jgi:hypothetical protein